MRRRRFHVAALPARRATRCRDAPRLRMPPRLIRRVADVAAAARRRDETIAARLMPPRPPRRRAAFEASAYASACRHSAH